MRHQTDQQSHGISKYQTRYPFIQMSKHREKTTNIQKLSTDYSQRFNLRKYNPENLLEMEEKHNRITSQSKFREEQTRELK